VNRADRVELRTLAIALLASLLLWNLPFGGVLLYPFKLLATWLHELSHGLAMLVTGTGVDSVDIYRDTSGLARSSGPQGPIARPIIAAAGYMGTSLWGAVMLVVTPNGRTVWFWAIAWLGWSLAVLFVALRVSGRRALAEVAPYTRPARRAE
jgi:hypothetical protein